MNNQHLSQLAGDGVRGESLMQTVRVVAKTDADGSLSLRIPLGQPEAEFEVVVVVQPTAAPVPGPTPEQRGWPTGYLDRTYGSIDDETFVRHPQGELPQPVEIA